MFIIEANRTIGRRFATSTVKSYWNGKSFGCKHFAKRFTTEQEANEDKKNIPFFLDEGVCFIEKYSGVKIVESEA
jgi:hypothetical protein